MIMSHPEENCGWPWARGARQNLGFLNNISTTQQLELATSNLVHNLGLTRPIIKLHTEEEMGWSWARGAPQNFGFPCNIFATAGVSDFRFGAQLGFAKTYHKITCRRKGGLHEVLKIWWFPFNIYTMAEASVFKFGTQLGFAKAHHKTTLRGKAGVVLG